MAPQDDIPEPVQDARWEATFQASPYYPSETVNVQRSGRRVVRQETWIREKRLGHGSFGVVWLEKAHSSNQHSVGRRAVKELKLGRKDGRRRECIRELEALIKFSQKKFVESFVEFYSWFESPDALFIATEYCRYGDLKQFVKDNGPIPEPQVQAITDQVLQGIIFMHDNNFAHRDLKPANILIKQKPPDQVWHVKICDMGLRKCIGTDITSTTVKGTLGFIAPERILGIGSSPSSVDPFPCDMWCLGEISFFILTGGTTFDNALELQGYATGNQGFPHQRLNAAGASGLAKNFIRRLMVVRPSERLSANEASTHRWMISFNKSQGHRPHTAADQARKDSSFPHGDHSKASNLQKWMAGISMEEDAHVPRPKPIQRRSTGDSAINASGSWNSATHHPINEAYISSTDTQRTLVENDQPTSADEYESSTESTTSSLEDSTLSDEAADSTHDSSYDDYNSKYEQYGDSSTRMATIREVGGSTGKNANQEWDPDPDLTGKVDLTHEDVKELKQLSKSLEAEHYPELKVLANFNQNRTRKYVHTMRTVLRYLCITGFSHPSLHDANWQRKEFPNGAKENDELDVDEVPSGDDTDGGDDGNCVMEGVEQGPPIVRREDLQNRNPIERKRDTGEAKSPGLETGTGELRSSGSETDDTDKSKEPEPVQYPQNYRPATVEDAEDSDSGEAERAWSPPEPSNSSYKPPTVEDADESDSDEEAQCQRDEDIMGCYSSTTIEKEDGANVDKAQRMRRKSMMESYKPAFVEDADESDFSEVRRRRRRKTMESGRKPFMEEYDSQ